MKQMKICDIDFKRCKFKNSGKKTTGNVIKPNKCNQCDYASSRAGDLRTHLKTHSGEKSNKCDQCDFASSRAGHLRTHLKMHSGEKPNVALAVFAALYKQLHCQLCGEECRPTVTSTNTCALIIIFCAMLSTS